MESVAYISTKREGELVITNAAKQHLLKAIALCPSNVYGPGDAKKSSRKTQVKAANGKWPLYTDGGVNVVHIDVLVDAFMVLLKMPLSDPAWDGSRWLVTGENLTIRDMLSLFSTLGGNAGHKPWLQFPLWLLFVICWLGDKLGSTSFTRDRFAVATRYHWYNGDKARRKFSLKHIPARDAIADSVTWMRENDMVQPR